MRILFMTYFYPPLGGIPPQRSIRLSRALKRLGVDIVVLTTSNRQGWTDLDPSLLEKVKSLQVVRTPSPGTDALSKKRPLLTQAPKLLLIKLMNVLFMDYMFAWNFTAFFKAFSIIRKSKVDFVYNSTPPFSPFLTTALLKLFFPKIKVIGDFRDSFLKYPGIFETGNRLKNRLRYLFCRLWERLLIRHIDIFFTVSPPIREEYLNRYPLIKPGQFHIIYNGYDEEDWADTGSYKRGDKFRITYTGTFPLLCSPENFLKGYALAVKENERLKEVGEILMVGSFKRKDQADFNSFPYPELLRVEPPKPLKEAIRLQVISDVNLLVISSAGKNQVVTGKLFEYMRSGRPILALAPEGPAREIILKSRMGIVVDPDDIQGIKEAILKLFRDWEADALYVNPPEGFVEQFNSCALAKKFIEILERYL